MATNKNINECGWFYHAPEKKSKEKTEPVEAPYISQIPGLSDIPDDEYPTEPQGLYFKDTDTKFIRLSKQGGRKDLLVFRDKVTKSEEPQGYPRVDWYYLQDNAYEDAQTQQPPKPWKFLLPEYMVHDSYVPSFSPEGDPENNGPVRGRVPYATDKQTVFETEGRRATDKRIKIPEAKPPGYGVRNSRPIKPIKVKPQAGKPTPVETIKDHGSVTTGDKHANMNKILAYDYERQWHEQMLQSAELSPKSKRKGEPPIPSEYDDKYGRITVNNKQQTRQPPSPTSRRGDTEKFQSSNSQDKELFKLTRFKNIPAKIDSHQPTRNPVSPIN